MSKFFNDDLKKKLEQASTLIQSHKIDLGIVHWEFHHDMAYGKDQFGDTKATMTIPQYEELALAQKKTEI